MHSSPADDLWQILSLDENPTYVNSDDNRDIQKYFRNCLLWSQTHQNKFLVWFCQDTERPLL